jgi:glycosyltransferase involved in cell wall biosynthesis
VPRISVIVPTRNRAAFLVGAVESVRRQTLTDWECIVVDDGSTDDTERALGELASADGRIRHLHQATSGCAGRARNAALRLAQGALVAFLDDDDTWYPEKLALQTAVLDADPGVGLVFARIRKYGLKRQVWPDARVPPRPTFGDLARGNFVPTSTVVVRRSVLETTGLFDERYPLVEDFDLWLRVARVAGLFGLTQVLCDYRVHPGASNVRRVPEELAILEQIYDRLERECDVPRSLLVPGRRELHLRRLVLRVGGVHRTLTHLWKALNP